MNTQRLNSRPSPNRLGADIAGPFDSENNPAAMADIFLRRLKRVLLLRFYTDNLLTSDDRRLLDQAIYSTYCDCQGIGAGDDARELLSEARAGSGMFKRPIAVER